MKKLVSLILCLAMILAWVPAGSPSAAAADISLFAGGAGTKEDPFMVNTVGGLQAMAGYPNTYFLQVGDIDASSLSGEFVVLQLPQGSVYDGGGHAITGLNVPLFYNNLGTIQNLTLEEPWIHIDKLSYFIDHNTDISIGALACSNSGTIQNCHVNGGRLYLKTSDNYSSPPKEERVLHQTAGMLVGENNGTVKNCSGTYKESKYYGSNSGVYTSCSVGANYFTIRVVQGTGGLVGWNHGGSMENCYCDYPVQAGSSGDNSVYFDLTKRRGVLCGNNEGTISGSYFDGNTSAASGEGSVAAQQMAVGQDLVDQLNLAGGEPFWGLDGDGYMQMNARTLGVSSMLPSGVYDMWIEPVEIELVLNEDVSGGEIYYTILNENQGKQPYTDPITRENDTDLLVYGQLSDSVYQASRYHYIKLRYPVRAEPGSGTYDKPIQVKLDAGQAGAEIYYTTDGSDPKSSDSRYPYNDGDFVNILATTTLRAAAKVDGVFGDVLDYDYVISPAVTAQPGEGEYDQPIEVTLDVRDGYEIWYTMDGSDPTQGTGIKYEAPITICQTTDLKVVAAREGKWGEVKTFSYRYPQVTITAEPGEGEQTDAVHVTLTCSADYAQLFYQMDDGEEQAYTGPVDIFETATLTVYARYDDQLLATETFTYTLPEIEIKATPEPGNYPSIRTITLSCNRSEAELYYSIGSSAVSWDGIRYTGPFELDHSATIWVEARMGGETVERKSFDYKVDVPKVTADPAPGDQKAPLSVTLSTDPAYEIWYTTDGSDPKTNGKKYEGPIQIDKPVATVIRAVPKSIDFEDTWGTTSDFRYTFNSQKVEVSTVRIVKWADYEASIRYYSTLPYDKTVDVCVAAYYNGKMLGTAVKQVTLSKNSSTTVDINYPYDPYTQLPSGAVLKVFCLDSETQEPCTEPYTCSAYSIRAYERLQEIIAEPTSIEGYVGDIIEVETKIRKTNKAEPMSASDWWEISDTSVAKVAYDDYRRKYIKLEGPGTATLTCSYSENNITKTVEIPITVKESVYQPEFLANPTAEPLPEDAIPISNAEELAALSDSADGANTRGKTFYLTNDIQLTGEWEPVRGFQGTLDGRGHKISGLYISSMYGEGEQLAGVFGSAYNAAFKNLAVEIDSRGIRALKRGDAAYAGGLVGNSKNTDYINCYTTGGRITAQGDGTYAGGLVGWLMNGPENRVVNCFSDCEVNAESQKATATNLCVAGGLIGQLESSNANQMTELSRCYFTGEVDAWYTAMGTTMYIGHCAGGLVGTASRVAILDSFSQGKVTVSKYYDTVTPMVVGGLVGNAMESTISRCYASGTTYARAAMSGTSTDASYVGGLYGVPTVDSLAVNSYRAAQEVSGNWHSNPKYNNAGTELTYDQAGDAGFYSGFDFAKTWTITEGAFQGKPHLQYQD